MIFYHKYLFERSEGFHKIFIASDQTPGKEGGTWLGLSKHGRIGVLLNLSSKSFANNPTALGRGFLVPNYLNHKEDMNDYVKKLSMKSASYNPFNLVLFEKNM